MEGKSYEIDLSAENAAAKLREVHWGRAPASGGLVLRLIYTLLPY